VRTGWTRLRLLDEGGEALDWAATSDPLAPGEVAERAVSVVHAGARGDARGKPLFRARLIVPRLSPQAAARAAKAQHRRQSRCRAGKALQPLTVRATGHLMLLTSLPADVPAAEVLGAYRLRWQVELAFKRLRSLLGLDRLPAKSEPLARSWPLAHLILAPLIDDASQELLDSPPCGGCGTPPAHLAVAHHARAPRHPLGRGPWRVDRRRAARRTHFLVQAPSRATTSARKPIPRRTPSCIPLSWRP
jgi:Transposase DDE domain